VVDDFNIVQKVLLGETEAYASLVRAYQVRIKSFCLMLLSNPAETEDAAQDVFVKAYQSLSGFHGESSFSTWLYRIAHNHCMDLLRKKSHQKTDSLEAFLEKNHNWKSSIATLSRDRPLNEDDQELINNVLSSLRSEYKEILILREVSGLTYQEISSVLRCSLDAVKARLRRARQDMQEKARHFLGSEIV
jgi:RNA polymerase sigma-70 factor (ECF subfamily)